MTDYIRDSPIVALTWCPTCEPDRNPMTEILDVRYCDLHQPDQGGDKDFSVVVHGISGTSEAGGEANRLWCGLIHRDSRK